MEQLKIDQVIYPTDDFSEVKVVGIYPGGQGPYKEIHYELLIKDLRVKLPGSFISALFETVEDKAVREIQKAQLKEEIPVKSSLKSKKKDDANE